MQMQGYLKNISGISDGEYEKVGRVYVMQASRPLEVYSIYKIQIPKSQIANRAESL